MIKQGLARRVRSDVVELETVGRLVRVLGRHLNCLDDADLPTATWTFIVDADERVQLCGMVLDQASAEVWRVVAGLDLIEDGNDGTRAYSRELPTCVLSIWYIHNETEWNIK